MSPRPVPGALVNLQALNLRDSCLEVIICNQGDDYGEQAREDCLTVKYVQASGEPWLLSVSTDPPAREQISNLLEAHGLKLERYEPFGEESAKEKPFGGLVVAVAEA